MGMIIQLALLYLINHTLKFDVLSVGCLLTTYLNLIFLSEENSVLGVITRQEQLIEYHFLKPKCTLKL